MFYCQKSEKIEFSLMILRHNPDWLILQSGPVTYTGLGISQNKEDLYH